MVLSLMSYLSATLLFLAVCQVAQAGQNEAYPFSIENEKTANRHRLMATNSGLSPVTVRLSLLDTQHVSADRIFPVYAVVPPGGMPINMGEIKPSMTNVGYSFRTNYTFMLGDMNATPSPDAMYRLPYRDGSTYTIGQAPGGPISTHTRPDSQYAVDIPMPEGTPILAAREGLVIAVKANQVNGAQTADMLDKANEVKILHADGTMASYVHLAHGGVLAYPGQRVVAGQQIGLAGSTGYSSGPHLHFAILTVRKNGDQIETVSLPFRFYVGSPPTTFVPQTGMLARADYAATVPIPSMDSPTLASPRPTMSSGPRSIAPINITVSPSFARWVDRMKTSMLSPGGVMWTIGFVIVVLLMIHTRRETGRRK